MLWYNDDSWCKYGISFRSANIDIIITIIMYCILLWYNKYFIFFNSQ